MKIATIVVALVLAACSSSEYAAPEPTPDTWGQGGASSSSAVSSSSGASLPGDGSGTRLLRRMYASPDGLRVHVPNVAIYDAEKQVDCFFSHAKGSCRCMPAGAAIVDSFTDAACTVPAGRINKASGTPKFMVDGHALCSQAAPPVARWFATGKEVVKAYTLNNGSCGAVPDGEFVTHRFFTAGAEVDYASFVPISIVVE